MHKPNNAQWRYGFLAVLKDGSRVYGEPSKEDIGSASLQVPENTEHLWLVVAATPKEIYDTGADNQYFISLHWITQNQMVTNVE
ncbi:DUF6055 domain-containing protein [Bacteroides ovatus]|nr:DUF6055 domain-containing protein [Bacteroides ovatus]